MSEFRLLIDGAMVAGDLSMDVLNPATETPFATCARASEAQVDLAVAAARRALPGWAATPIAERRKAILAIADVIEANTAELAHILVGEQGKPLHEATGEVGRCVGFIRGLAAHDLRIEVIEDSPTQRIEVRRKPLGVVAAILPWNAPLMILGFKLAPALLAGNTLIVKPSGTTPLATLRVADLVKDLVPPGVLGVLADADDLGGALTGHPGVNKISFTGSTGTGQKIMAAAARDVKRFTLEMGGNDAGIILEDVDPVAAAPRLFAFAFPNCGQVCGAMKRIYVHESIYDTVCDELAKVADAAVVGDGLQQGVQIGPLQNRKQFERVLGLIEDSRERGRIIAGGERVGTTGYFIRPTVVRDLPDDARLVVEEQFGPVVPVLSFKDEDEVIARANDTTFGLNGSVWSNDIDRAARLAARLETGSVYINKHAGIGPDIPMSGAKMSGFGVELSEHGLNEYTQLQVISIPR